jgi:RNA polymerase sigma-70 factor (ECF subfamily)
VGRELAVAVESAVDALPDDFRAVFMLRAVEQLSVAETALSLDIPEETVKTRFFRARAHLKEDLASALEAQAPRAFAFDGARCDRIVARVLERLHGELTRSKEKEP